MTRTKAAFSLALFVSLGLFSSPVNAQRIWHDVDETRLPVQVDRQIVPARYRVVVVDTADLSSTLQGVPDVSLRDSDRHFMLPAPEGGEERFRIARSRVMDPALEERFPGIRTYVGVSTERPAVIARFELTPLGFHAMVLDPFLGDWFMDPYAQGMVTAAVVYRKRDFSKMLPAGFNYCSYHMVNDMDAVEAQMRTWEEAMGGERAGDCQKRTYRLALACTGEYANFHGSNTTNNNKAFAMAAMVTSMNRVNGIYERDLAVTMVMVPNNDQLIFLNPSTDPYTNSDGFTMLGQNQTTCTNIIGGANYDIGHVFSTGGGGVASLGSVCSSNNKARGVTGGTQPVNDPFDIDYVAHEIGHQFGANHTQNNNCNRVSAAAYEPGSASTIMGYAGICSPNVQNLSDALFHAYSLQEMTTFLLGNGGSCAQTTSSGNTAPIVSAGPAHTIPRSTPFVLTASASDADPGTQLTYTWEQFNNQISTQPPVATNNGGPNFRALLPSSSPQRWFPNLTAVVNNQNPTWEVLSSVTRTFNFRVTVRDNNPQAGCTAESNRAIAVTANAGPFLVTQPNTSVNWQAGSSQTVTWDVAGTTASPVSCATVDILMSVDGGFTYPHTLATATTNDGSQLVQLPLVSPTTTARIMVRANGNVFYDISNTNFTISAAPAPPALSARVKLEGPTVSGSGLMSDALRSAGLIPLQEPYTALGFEQAAGGGGASTSPSVLAVTGADAIVDWVQVELRNPTAPSQLVATRQALLQRDGDVVSTDGTSPLTFSVATGSYHVVIRHRNHLGCMTAAPVSLTAVPLLVDLTAPATATFGTDARKSVEGGMVLWAGNAVRDGRLLYTGEDNDRDALLLAVGGVVPTATAQGYLVEDITMDGTVKYTGENNDRDIILTNIGGVVPTNTRLEQLP